MSSLPKTLGEEEQGRLEEENKLLSSESSSESSTKLSIPSGYLMLDVSKYKDYMAVLTNEWILFVYKLKYTNGDLEYIGNPAEYQVGAPDNDRNFYVYLSVASDTGNVAISFVEYHNDGKFLLFTDKKPQPSRQKCRIFSNGIEKPGIPFQGRAVYVKNKLVLVGEHTLDVYYADTLKLKYFLDLEDLKRGYEAFIGWESLSRHSKWAKYVPTITRETNNETISTSGTNEGEQTGDGDRLILMTQHIQDNILVTNYRGNLTRVWSILDGSLLVSFITENIEYVMAISEDKRYVATYDDTGKKVKVYCTKSNLPLYTYVPQGEQTERCNISVTYVRFHSYRPYLIISGVIKDPTAVAANQNQHKAFYEIWSIYQERLIVSKEEPGIHNDSIQSFVLECSSEMDEEEYNNSQSNGNGTEGISENNSNSLGSVRFQKGLESNSHDPGSSSSQPVPDSSISSGSTVSNTPPPDPAPKEDTKSNKNHLSVYGMFAKQDDNGKLVFRKKLVFKYNKTFINLSHVPENRIDWEGFSFQKLGGLVQVKKTLSDICEPLDGKNTLGYISTHRSGVYLLRFGTHMVQLWQLTKIPRGERESASEANHIFDFQNVLPSSAAKYYNTIEHSQLKFARAYTGYHQDDLSSLRNTWRSTASNIHFMKDKGHILVYIEKFPKNTKSSNAEDQPENMSTQSHKSKLKEFGIRIHRTFTRQVFKKAETKIPKDELFLPLSRIGSSGTDYEFCEIESIFQALHHLDSVSYENKEQLCTEGYTANMLEVNKKILRKKVLDIINLILDSQSCRRYFSTISGSKTLAALAYTAEGQKLLFKIIIEKNFPIHVFSYMGPGKLKENVLTVLMEKANYDLYSLMFNRILIDYYKNGSGNLSAVMDALIFLQEENYTSQLLTSTKKLSFLPVNRNSIQILNSEMLGMLSIKGLQQEDTYRVEYLDTFSSMEQIERYNYYKWYMPFSYMSYHFTLIKHKKITINMFKLLRKIYYIIFGSIRMKSSLAELCIVPLPYFNSYRSFSEKTLEAKKITGKDKKSMKTETFNDVTYYKYSPFSLLASSTNKNNIFRQGDTVMEMLVSYKWETFAKNRFYWILFVHLVYYASYTTGISFPEELFDYKPGNHLDHSSHIAAIVFMFLSGTLLLIQEYRQFSLSKWEYFRSFYNYIDLAAFVLPATTFGLLLTRSPESTVLYSVSSVTTMILWIHFILRLRVFRPFGTLLEIIIQLTGKIFHVIIITIVIVLGFTNSLVVLLRRQENGFFQDQFGPPGSDTASLSNQSQQNNFKDVFLSFTTVWLFIFGYFDPVFDGDVGNYVMLIIFVVLFSVIVVLILFNVVIALMSGTIDKIIDRGNKIWISHFAAVVSEIELLWVLDSTKFSKKNNPTHIYYNANVETIRLRHASLVEENDDLKIKIERERQSQENK